MSQIFQATPYDSLQPGMSAELTRLCRQEDLFVFAQSSGNLNPLHMPDADGDGDGTPEAKASGMWLGALVSAVLGNQLPGPGTVLRAQSLRFLGQAHAGETVVVRAEVANKGPDNAVHLTLTVRTDTGKPLAEGTAEVTAPTTAQRFDASDVPGLTVQRHVHFDRLLEAARALSATPTAVIAPEEPDALGGCGADLDRPDPDRGSRADRGGGRGGRTRPRRRAHRGHRQPPRGSGAWHRDDQ